MTAASSPPPRVSVVMPTYEHAAFIRRAVGSLLAQSLDDWELLVIDDASPDETRAIVESQLRDTRITYRRLARNSGLGAALNEGLSMARAPLVAYLPSDDVYHRDHLASLAACLDARPDASLAYSGVRHHYNRVAQGRIEDRPLQLVQVMHRRSAERWLEREELVTDDLGRMFWDRLGRPGDFVSTRAVTCEWVEHPGQLQALLREPLGGINAFRSRFNVPHPLRFHSSVGNRIDEAERYRAMRERPDTPRASDGLRILLVGELAYNAERVLALEERGHKLYGLWMPRPHSLNTVGPLPFGHVEDVAREGWQEAVRRIKPDVIYALLNWQAVPFAHHVLSENPGIPFVWHFKEGPFICLEKGIWRELLQLTEMSDGALFSSPEMREWFETVAPGTGDPGRTMVLDGDLPKRDWFLGKQRSARLSEGDGEIHTVVPGRPIGLHVATVAELAAHRIHVHFYGDFTHGLWKEWIPRALAAAPGRLHLHSNVDQEDWTEEFSRYDAGWLHVFPSRNGGDLRNADWDDLNYPARIGTLVQAGLPMLTGANEDSIVATQSLVRDNDFGVLFRDVPHLSEQLRDTRRMDEIRDNVWRRREEFTFDHHADALLEFLRCVAGRGRSSHAA